MLSYIGIYCSNRSQNEKEKGKKLGKYQDHSREFWNNVKHESDSDTNQSRAIVTTMKSELKLDQLEIIGNIQTIPTTSWLKSPRIIGRVEETRETFFHSYHWILTWRHFGMSM